MASHRLTPLEEQSVKLMLTYVMENHLQSGEYQRIVKEGFSEEELDQMKAMLRNPSPIVEEKVKQKLKQIPKDEPFDQIAKYLKFEEQDPMMNIVSSITMMAKILKGSLSVGDMVPIIFDVVKEMNKASVDMKKHGGWRAMDKYLESRSTPELVRLTTLVLNIIVLFGYGVRTFFK